MPVLRRFGDVPSGATVTADYTPAVGEKLYLRQLSTQGPANTTAKGSLVWDPDGENLILEAWSGDKLVEFPKGVDEDFAFTGDGVKKLRLKLENSSQSSVRIGGACTYEQG